MRFGQRRDKDTRARVCFQHSQWTSSVNGWTATCLAKWFTSIKAHNIVKDHLMLVRAVKWNWCWAKVDRQGFCSPADKQCAQNETWAKYYTAAGITANEILSTDPGHVSNNNWSWVQTSFAKSSSNKCSFVCVCLCVRSVHLIGRICVTPMLSWHDWVQAAAVSSQKL